ncbi:hypothetical protein [Streptomyces sp. DH24]|uniref:hypothetical protein n=1 Tax=Streptomyces sp. DH24 TaxID=3040123 RepID=UPI00244129F4|nr:hypothetical protein [Streptomyces sp. DH24]MDG9717388.1 hypothetical protein [Streptomyces sp. DH24]
MNTRPVTGADPVYLGFPLVEPTPVTNCPSCHELAQRREAARRAGDLTTVSDCNVLMRRCTH